MRAVAAMMELNEDTRLEAWLLYHGHLFGFENLYVYDNGSTSPKVGRILAQYAGLGVHVDRDHIGPDEFHNKGLTFTRKFQELEADLFFPLDCDEFVTLLDENGTPTADRAAILGYLSTIVRDPRVLVADNAYTNVLGCPGEFMPPYGHHKVFFTAGCCESLDHGFHRGKSRKSEHEYVTRLVYLHFHHRPLIT